MFTITNPRLVRLIIALVIVAALFPTATIAQEHGASAPGTPLTITFTPVDVVDPGQEWADAQGIFHLRGGVNIEAVSGDLEGTATTTFSGDGMVTGECTEQACEGVFFQWVGVEIESEDGGWSGRAALSTAFDGNPEQTSVRAILIGRGGNAGKAILIDQVLGFGEDEAITFGGYLLEQAGPVGGVNLRYELCFTGEDSAAGGYIMQGPFEDSGSVDATFTLVGAPAPGAIYGDLTITSERGELYGTFVEFSVEGTDHNIGSFVLLGGTGDYEGVYGFGKVIETVTFGEEDGCAGPGGYWIGESFGG